MVQSILIVGAGIIGAATALQLARAGHRVRLIHNGQADATRAAFGWINASFYLDADHHRLRVAGIDAWRRLTGDVSMRVEWQGCLCWDMDETDLARTYDALQALDYPVEMLSRARVQQMEPALAECPEQALYFPQEGAAHSAEIARQLLAEGQRHGVQVVNNVTVLGVTMQGDRAVGVDTSEGVIAADQVILAAGTGTAKLAGSVGADIPLVPRPAYILRTTPVAKTLNHILATPEGEIRQEPSGALLMPVVAGHQGDTTGALPQTADAAADAAMARLRSQIKGLEDVTWSEVTRAERPVPADDQPVVGALGAGLYAAVLHSGITLGPLIGELIAKEVIGGADNATTAMLAPYRPNRFAT